MGKVVEAFTFWNLLHENEVRRGLLNPLVEKCVVDTGAWTTIIPLRVAQALRLSLKPGWVQVTFADGRRCKRSLATGLCVGWNHRDTICQAVIEPGRKDILIGQLVLEGMDLLVDGKHNRVVPRTPGEPVFEILALG